LYVFPMSVDFAVRAGWGIIEAIRELVQNALDATEDVSKVRLDVVEDVYTLFIVENPSEDKILFNRDITFGGSKKKCYHRGVFGRGLKETASVVLTQGGTLYVISHDVAYRFVEVPSREKAYIGVLLGRPKRPLWGKIRVILWSPEGYRSLYEDVIRVILFDPKNFEKCWTFDYLYTCTNTDGSKSSKVIKVGVSYGGKSKLYVRDLFVNTMRLIFDDNAVFSYNIPNVSLEESRRNVADVFEAEDMILSMYNVLNEKYPHILDEMLNIVVNKTTSMEDRYVYVKLRPWFERRILIHKPFSDKFVGKILSRYNLSPERTGIGESDEVIRVSPLIEHFGLNAIVTDVYLDTDAVKSIIELIKDIGKEEYNRAKMERVSPEDLSEGIVRDLMARGYNPSAIFMVSALFGFIKDILKSYYPLLKRAKTYISFGRTKYSAGLTAGSEVYVQYQHVARPFPNPQKMIEYIVHEYAHVGSRGAPDNTEVFVNTLQDMFSKLIYELTVPKNFITLALAISGYYIDVKEVYEEHKFINPWFYSKELQDDLLDILAEKNVGHIDIYVDVVGLEDIVSLVGEYIEGQTIYGVAYQSAWVSDVPSAIKSVLYQARAFRPCDILAPISVVVFKAMGAEGMLLLLGVKPLNDYYVNFEGLKERLKYFVGKLFRRGYADYVRVDLYNPYENRYYTYVCKKINEKVETKGWS